MFRLLCLIIFLQGCAVIPATIPILITIADIACDSDIKCKAGKIVAGKIKENHK